MTYEEDGGLRGNCWCEAYTMGPNYPHRPTCTTNPPSAVPVAPNLDGLAEWLKFMRGNFASLAHIPEVAEHIEKLKRWEAAVISLTPTPQDLGRQS